MAQQQEQLLAGMERSAGIVKNLGGLPAVSDAMNNAAPQGVTA